MRHVRDQPGDREGQRVHPVDDHHRDAQQGGLERRRPGRRHGCIAGRHRIVPPLAYEPAIEVGARHTRPLSAFLLRAQDPLHLVLHESRGDREQELQVAKLFLQPAPRAEHDMEVRAQFVPAAPREQRHGRPSRIETQGPERLLSRARGVDEFQQWMTDELDADTGPSVDLFLERQDDQHPIHHRDDLPDPALAPGPDLGADEVQDRHPRGSRLLRQSQVEIGIIDEQHEIGPIRREQDVPGFPVGAPDGTRAREHLEEAGHPDAPGIAKRAQTGRAHGRPADAGEPDVPGAGVRRPFRTGDDRLVPGARPARHRPHHQTAVKVARGFPRDDQDVRDAAAHGAAGPRGPAAVPARSLRASVSASSVRRSSAPWRACLFTSIA